MKIVTLNGLIMRQGIREDYILENETPIFNYELKEEDKVSVIDTIFDIRTDYFGSDLKESKSLNKILGDQRFFSCPCFMDPLYRHPVFTDSTIDVIYVTQSIEEQQIRS